MPILRNWGNFAIRKGPMNCSSIGQGAILENKRGFSQNIKHYWVLWELFKPLLLIYIKIISRTSSFVTDITENVLFGIKLTTQVTRFRIQSNYITEMSDPSAITWVQN